MEAAMTGHIAGACAGGVVPRPGGLTVAAQQGHHRQVKVDQVGLFAAMRVVTGVAGGKRVEVVQVFSGAPAEVGGGDGVGGQTLGIGIVLVTLEAQLARVVNVGTTIKGRAGVIGVDLGDVLG